MKVNPDGSVTDPNAGKSSDQQEADHREQVRSTAEARLKHLLSVAGTTETEVANGLRAAVGDPTAAIPANAPRPTQPGSKPAAAGEQPKPGEKPPVATDPLGQLLGVPDRPDSNSPWTRQPAPGQPDKPPTNPLDVLAGQHDKPASAPPAADTAGKPTNPLDLLAGKDGKPGADPNYTHNPLLAPIVKADPSVLDRQAAKVDAARQAVDAAQAKLDAAAGPALWDGPLKGPGRDVTDPLTQQLMDARRNLTTETKLLQDMNGASAEAGGRTVPVPKLPENADVQSWPAQPSFGEQAAKGLTDVSHDLNKGTFGLVPDVAQDIHTFNHWGEASAGERTGAVLDAASLVPGGKLLGEAHHGWEALSGIGRHADELPTPHVDAPVPHHDVPPPVEHHVDAPPAEHHADGLNQVHAESGGPGNWNQELNRPAPMTHYTVDERFSYATDSESRVGHAEMNYDHTHEPGDRNGYQQRIAGGDDRLPGDHGGHIFGTQFGGPGEGINITAMRDTLNSVGTRDYYNLEQQWRQFADQGSQVQVKVDMTYPGNSMRPDSYTVETFVDGQLNSTHTFFN
ncbi:hypothetical protein D2E80_22300 [Mycobacteroides abscessus]|nr:hypothetical protein D2E80_22300 [Mycobacteroides abscessus]